MSQKLTMEGNTILNSVIRTISGAFPDVDIYNETVNEGCEFPYFMVLCEDFTQEKLMRKNYLQSFVISVLYQYKELPETYYTDSNEIGYKLSDILELITLPNGDKLRGNSINWYPDNQKLEFYINYDIKVAKEKQPVPKQMKNSVNVYKK